MGNITVRMPPTHPHTSLEGDVSLMYIIFIVKWSRPRLDSGSCVCVSSSAWLLILAAADWGCTRAPHWYLLSEGCRLGQPPPTQLAGSQWPQGRMLVKFACLKQSGSVTYSLSYHVVLCVSFYANSTITFKSHGSFLLLTPSRHKSLIIISVAVMWETVAYRWTTEWLYQCQDLYPSQ